MARLQNSKKGFALAEVPSLAIMLVVIAIILGLGLTIVTQIAKDQCSSGNYGRDGKCYAACAALTNITFNSANSRCENLTDSAAYTTVGAGTVAFNASASGASGLNTLAAWMPTWAVIVAAAVVIGVIGAYLMFGRR